MAIRALVVDDEADILHLIEIKLKKAGFEVVTAHDGQEGLDKALAEKPDIMLVDVMMPKMDGYTVVSEVRHQLGSEAPIIIFLTAKGQEADVVKGLSTGADDYIIKPFAPRELLARINVILIKHGMHSNTGTSE
jgi:two-component system alkaline phosphatase synthesis response regulator PhoP